MSGEFTDRIWALIGVAVSPGKRSELEKFRWLRPDKPKDNVFGYIAYEVTPDGSKARMKIKTGRFLTRKLGLDYMSSDSLKNLVDAINELFWPAADGAGVELLTGDAIIDAYRDEVGSESCMTGDNCDCVRLYAMNPDRFSLLVLRLGNDSGRAIVSTFDDGRCLLDRIYASCADIANRMIVYARGQGWLIRDYVGAGPGWQVSGLRWVDGGIPYMDTLCYGTIADDGTLTVSAWQGDFKLTTRDGYIESKQCMECDCCVNAEEAIHVGDGYVCGSCFDNYYTYCDDCNEATPRTEITAVQDQFGNWDICNSCLERHYFRCDECHEYFREGGVVLISEPDCAVCHDCFAARYGMCEECGGAFGQDWLTPIESLGVSLCDDCRDEQCALCDGCREYFHKEELDENNLCKNCAAETEAETETGTGGNAA